MTSRTAPIALVALAGIAFSMAACTAAGPGPAPSDTSDGPLRQYLATLLGYGQSEQERAAEDRRVEEVIATCMAAEGFDYVPVSHDDPYYRPDEWRPDDPDWVAQWGYGAVRFPGKPQMLAAQAAGDANTAYYDGLSAAEQAAWSDILYGPAPTDDQIAASLDGSVPLTWEQQGCWGRGNHEVRGDDPLDDAEHTVLRQAVLDFQATQFAAPEYAELNADWADCMAGAGFSGFDRPEAARTSIYDAQSEIYGSQTVSDEDDPRFADLYEHEVELALADLGCRDETDFRDRSWAIQVAQEEQFIADHRAEFDELQAEIDSGG